MPVGILPRAVVALVSLVVVVVPDRDRDRSLDAAILLLSALVAAVAAEAAFRRSIMVALASDRNEDTCHRYVVPPAGRRY